MKKVIFLFAFIFSAVLFYNNSSAQTTDCADKCSKDGSASSCDMTSCDMTSCEHSSSSGNVQGVFSDSLESETKTEMSGAVCPVSGESIPEGGGVNVNYLGKDYKLCCRGCVAAFMEEPMDYISEELTCPVEGGAAHKEVSTMYNGMKYYFCCEGCDKEFLSDPDKYLSQVQNSSKDSSEDTSK